MSIVPQSLYSCTSCSSLQPNLFFCPRCVSLRCSNARCTISSVEVVACPRCLRTTTPSDALHRLRGRCDAGASCLDCPKCRASLLILDKQSPETSVGATHKCKECSLLARFVNSQDGPVDEDATTASVVAQSLRSSTLVVRNLCAPDPIGMAAVEASQRLNRIELRKLRAQSRKGALKSSSDGILQPVVTTAVKGLQNENYPLLPWLGQGSDAIHDVISKPQSTPVALEAQERERQQQQQLSKLESHWKNQMNTIFGFKQELEKKVVLVTVKASGTRLASFCQVRCSSCVAAGDPGVLVSVSPEPFKALLTEASERVLKASNRVNAALSWTPAYIFRKQSPAAAILPLLSLVLVDTTAASLMATQGISVVNARLQIKNPTEKPMYLSFQGKRLPLIGHHGSESNSSTLKISLLDSKSEEGVILIKEFKQEGDGKVPITSDDADMESIYVRISAFDPLRLHNDEEDIDDIDAAIASNFSSITSQRVIAAEGVGSITLNCSITMSMVSSTALLAHIPFVYHVSNRVLSDLQGGTITKSITELKKSLSVIAAVKIIGKLGQI